MHSAGFGKQVQMTRKVPAEARTYIFHKFKHTSQIGVSYVGDCHTGADLQIDHYRILWIDVPLKIGD